MARRAAPLLDNIRDSDYRGINNPASLCYLTSVLQGFFMTHRFPEAVKRGSATHPAFLDPLLDGLFSVLQARPADAEEIAKALGVTGPDVYQQRDAAEYFHKILSGTSPDASRMFRGRLRHSITCRACGTPRMTDTPFWTLLLPLRPRLHRRSPYDLRMAFEEVFKPSTVTGDDRIYCDRCEAKRDATIACRWAALPQVLTLQLKRFHFDHRLDRYEKITCPVEVPLNLHTEGGVYELYARVNHYGGLAGGHYTARIRSYETGGWYDFDDARVRLVHPQPFGKGESTTKSSSAYLLLYRKELPSSNMGGVAGAGGVVSEGEWPLSTTEAGSMDVHG